MALSETAQLIINHTIELLETKPITSISIVEVTSSLQISRVTFYKYFRNIRDVLDVLVEELLLGFSQKLQKKNTHLLDFVNMNSSSAIKATLYDNALGVDKYFYANRKYIKGLLFKNSGIDFISMLQAVYYNHFHVAIENVLSMYDKKIISRYVNYMASGVTAIWQEWFINNFDLSVETITNDRLDMLAPSLTALYTRK